MSRIFWDTMMFVYLLEGHSKFAPQCARRWNAPTSGATRLLTSYLALGEVMAGGAGAHCKG